ncbi:MAG TPA: SPOR domain-containing protein [Gemmatimonadaceae bacterium]|nr:SPOR domain-containing protein [Gemmatimonadaceae bacterium]
MRRLVSSTVLALFATAGLANSSAAQDDRTTPSPRTATDSLFTRARRLVSEGDGATGRAIVDSILHASPEGTPAYGDALFWRGALAETAADAERDYRRVIVEYPLSPYADDALLSLAELEQARGDRAAAYQHLQRFVREHPAGPARARAGLAAARLAFEQRDMARGCAMIADARQSAGSTDVELRNQIDYHGAHCAATATATAATPAPSTVAPSGRSSGSPSVISSPPPRTSSTAAATGARASTVPSPATAPHVDTGATASTPTDAPKDEPAARAPATKTPAARESTPRGIWTIQLAAYNTRPDAEALVRKLASRGVKARISGDNKPFRVRLDYYQTREAAAARVAELKQRGIIGFVTDEPRTAGVQHP